MLSAFNHQAYLSDLFDTGLVVTPMVAPSRSHITHTEVVKYLFLFFFFQIPFVPSKKP